MLNKGFLVFDGATYKTIQSRNFQLSSCCLKIKQSYRKFKELYDKIVDIIAEDKIDYIKYENVIVLTEKNTEIKSRSVTESMKQPKEAILESGRIGLDGCRLEASYQPKG